MPARFDFVRFRLIAATSARLTLRRYAASKAALLGGAALLLVALPLLIRASALRYPALVRDDGEARLGMFTLVWLLVALAPFVGSAAARESAFVRRLRLFPVAPGVLVLAVAAGAAADLPGALALPPAVALLAGAGLRAAAPLALLIAQGLLLGQCLLLAGERLARSRRFRESVSLLGTALALLALLLLPRAAWSAALPAAASLSAALPNGLATTATRAPATLALLGHLGLLAWTGAALRLAASLSARTAEDGREGGGARRAAARFPGLALPGASGAMAGKEGRYFVREPQLCGALSRSGIAVAAAGTLALQPPNAPLSDWAPTLGTAATLYGTLWALQVVCNAWGVDAVATPFLWLLPAPRWKMVLGKNAAAASFLALATAGVGIALRMAGGVPAATLFALAPSAAAGLVAALALGNVVSPLVPFPLLRPRRRDAGPTAGESFGTGMLHLFLGAAAALLACLPWSGLWAGLLYLLSVPVAARLLERREPHLVQALTD